MSVLFQVAGRGGGGQGKSYGSDEAPRFPEAPPDVLREDPLKALVATCEKGRDFESRRDAALIRVFVDTGARLSEVANLRLDLGDDPPMMST